ncbi:MAG TPA: cobalamin-binding protein [Methanoregula sp.]|nr:cobalamin-binding protein [Methanoregula sp.]
MKHSPVFAFVIFFAALCLVAVPALAATLNATSLSERTVTDDYGTTVTIHGTPERIVSLAPTNTEILFALGLGDQVVGDTDYCDYPAEAAEKSKVGGYSTVSVEKVILLKPDLVVASEGNGAELIHHLKELNMTVIVTKPKNVDGILNDITFIGNAAGADENATALVASLAARINNTEKNASALATHPKVAHIIWNEPIYGSGNGTFQDELITMAGGRNAFADKNGYATIGIEDFIAADPDILIVNSGSGMGGSENSIAQYFKNETRFSNVAAIKNHQVYVIDSSTVDRAGPRIVDALEIIAGDIHAAAALAPAGTPAQKTPGFEVVPALMALAAVIIVAARRMR